MKRIFSFIIAVIMILPLMTACNKNDDAVSNGLSKYLTEKDGDYILTLPQSQETRMLTEEQERFVPYITDKLVEKAEKKIIKEFKDTDTPDFLLRIREDYLCLYAELIKYKPFGGIFSEFDHEHCIFAERISSQPVKPENEEKQSEPPSIGNTKQIFSDYLDSMGFKGDLSRSKLESKYKEYTYNGIPLMDIAPYAHSIGELSNSWSASCDKFDFYIESTETYDGYVNDIRTIFTRVQLEGMPLPNGITFDDTTQTVLSKCEIQMNPEKDFVSDKENAHIMTLYSDDNTVIQLVDCKLEDGGDSADSYSIRYSSTVSSNNSKVTRSLTMTFNDDNKLSSFEISVDKKYSTEISIAQNTLIKEVNAESVYIKSDPPGYEYSFDGEYVEPIVNYFKNLNLISDFEENPKEYFGMTWIVSFSYSNGDTETVHLSGKMFIYRECGPVYKLAYEEANAFDLLLEQL